MVTWGEIKKAIDEKIEDDAKIKEIRISALYFRGVTVCYDFKKESYVILNRSEEES